MRNRKAAVAGVAIAVLAAVAGTASAAAASPAATPATTGSTTLIFTVHFSQFEALHLNPNPNPATGFGFGDELTFHDLLFAHGQQAGDEGGSCVIVDGAQVLANCTEVIRLQHGTITAEGLTGPPPTKHLAVTGGTGLYRTAGGQATLVEFGSTRGKLTIHLLGFSTGG
jgi:Allene oxide cyclase barrel like domain